MQSTINWKDVGIRAFKTAVQTFASLWTVDLLFTSGAGLDVAFDAVAAAGAAAIAVLWNAVIQWSGR